MSVKENWQGYAVAVLTSLILGSGGGVLFNNSRIAAAEDRMNKRVQSVEIREEKNFDILMTIAKTLAEVKVELKYMNQKIDNP